MTDNTTRSQSAKIKTPTFYFSVRKVGGGVLRVVVHANMRQPGHDVFCHLLQYSSNAFG